MTSCEAVPAPNLAARARGGASACRTDAVTTFGSFIPLFDHRLLWHILQPNPFARRQRGTRLADATQELGMVL